MKLIDKIVVITGRGIGRAIALKFAEEGAHVAICSRSTDELNKVAGEIEKLNRRVLAVKVDVAKEEDVDNFMKSVINKFGQIDILVNNAGVGGSSKLIWDMTYDERGSYEKLKE